MYRRAAPSACEPSEERTQAGPMGENPLPTPESAPRPRAPRMARTPARFAPGTEYSCLLLAVEVLTVSRYTSGMDGEEFATLLDGALTNPLLRGLDIACVRLLPADASWWSPRAYRSLEIYLYPGAFGSARLQYLDERALSLVERTAARLVGANEARLLPAPPVPLRVGEWLMEGGYSVMGFGSVLFVASSPALCAASICSGATAAVLGRLLYALMWRRAATPHSVPA